MSSPTVARGTPDLRATSAVDSEPFERGSAVAEANRYPGSPPFGDTDVDRLLFRGRAAETDEVLHSILSYDLFLVYAVSGMGKTSLLTAGVLEPLRQRGYFPVMLRVNSPDTPMLTLIEAQIRQAGAAAGVEVEHAPTVGADALPADTLWDLLAELEIWRGNDLLEPVLIFDQFEELFTLPWSPDDRAAFIEQFGEVVRHHRVPGRDADPARQALAAPNVKIVMCMREDFIGQLEELAVSVPQIMNRRFRLGALDPVQAQAAIREPAELDDPRLRTQRFSYSAGAASTILTFLRTKDDRGNTVLTDSIDPSQLQIICQHVERTILPRKTVGTDGRVEITESDLGGPDGLRRIVVDFYRQVLDAFPQRERRAVRHLCETGLISQSGRRLSLEEGEIGAHFDVSLDTLRKLVDLRLLRSEPRVGSVYYELAHDTLTRPIVAYRDHKRKERRRRLMIAALILAAVVAATIAGLLLASRGNDDEQPAARPLLPIEVGQSISDELTSADDAAVYELGAVDQPVVVQLSPLGFNAALEIADSQDSATTTARVEDVGKVGAPEFAVIRSGGPYRLTVRGLAPGQFELSVLQVRSNPLAVPGRTRVELTASGAPTLFELTGTDDQAFVVSIVTTSAEDGQQTRVPDGAVLQVTGPTGATLQAVPDDAGTLSIVAGGVAGPYVVALRDASGNASVTYTVSVSPMDVTPAPIGEATDVVVTESNRHAVWEVVASDPKALLLQLNDDYGEAQELIQTPKRAVLPLGPEGSADVEDGPGNYLVFLSSPWAGMASLSAVNVHVVDVDIGGTVPATLGADNEAAVFRVEAPGDIPLLAQVVSDENLDSVLSLVSGASTVVPASDNAAEGAAEQLVVPRDAPGSLLFAVTRFEDTAGTFEFSVGPAPVQPLAFGETASGELDSGQLALYTVTARDDTPFT
ncbi:MAG: hypothetical protein K0S92_733, partial [Desertimonas sp.]|nr:hypothetical protein [Desertimonas sp.]